MAGIPKPVVDPRFGPAWTPMLQAAQAAKQQTSALNSGAPQSNLLDQWGNTIQVQGSNLAQTVTIGASHGVSGVLVSTGIASGTAGLAVQSGPAITTITLTQGSTAATVGTVTGASLAVGQVIGAADVSDPSSGTPTPAITPGTTIAAVSGTSVTLSQGAAESGTALYCAAARFILQQDSGWVPLSLSAGMTSAYAVVPAARLRGDVVTLKGGIDASAGWAAGATLATLPVGMRPVSFPTPAITYFSTATSWAAAALGINPSGFISVLVSAGAGAAVYLDSVEFAIS
jgi:hypothetical protein